MGNIIILEMFNPLEVDDVTNGRNIKQTKAFKYKERKIILDLENPVYYTIQTPNIIVNN